MTRIGFAGAVDQSPEHTASQETAEGMIYIDCVNDWWHVYDGQFQLVKTLACFSDASHWLRSNGVDTLNGWTPIEVEF